MKNQDPANYRTMSEPFDDSGKADEAIQKFFGLVNEARNVCKIQDVHLLIKFHVMHNDTEKVAMTSGHLGNSSEGINMCIWGIKQELADTAMSVKEMLDKLET